MEASLSSQHTSRVYRRPVTVGERSFENIDDQHSGVWGTVKTHFPLQFWVTVGMVQAWVGQKLVNVTFYEFFCPILKLFKVIIG